MKRSSKRSYKKVDRAKLSKHKKSRIVSFLIGVAALIALGLIFYHYVQNNNYKEVLGKQTYIEKQSAR